MSKRIQVYGWDVSPFTAKVFSYLKYKQLDPVQIPPNAWQLNFKIKKDVGQIIMPVVYDETIILQDSSAIIDYYEKSYSSKSVIPDKPLHKISCYILELLGDDWLPLAALHYRWNYPQNRPFIHKEFGRNALPGFPRILQTLMAKKMGQRMSGYLPVLGITEQMQQPIEINTQTLFTHLNLHLSQHAFLFGSRPSMADFSLYGPIYAHMLRDPFPDRLLTPYPHIIKWINTLNGPINQLSGKWISSSALPLSLLPILQLWRSHHLPLIQASIESFETWCLHHPNSTKLPRSLGSTNLRINGISEKRLNLSYILWMWQRIQQVYAGFDPHEKQQADALLNQLDVLKMIQTPLPKTLVLKQCRLHVEPC